MTGWPPSQPDGWLLNPAATAGGALPPGGLAAAAPACRRHAPAGPLQAPALGLPAPHGAARTWGPVPAPRPRRHRAGCQRPGPAAAAARTRLPGLGAPGTPPRWREEDDWLRGWGHVPAWREARAPAAVTPRVACVLSYGRRAASGVDTASTGCRWGWPGDDGGSISRPDPPPPRNTEPQCAPESPVPPPAPDGHTQPCWAAPCLSL